MNIQELSPNNALIAGSPVWFVASESQSEWFHKMDWYSNFQFSKTKLHSKQEFDANLIQIIEDEELEITKISTASAPPIMLVGSHYFPTDYIIQLFCDQNTSWLEQIEQICDKMKISKLRIFLPKDFAREEFFVLANKTFKDNCEISLVSAI